MVAKLTTMQLAHSSLHKAFIFVFLAPHTSQQNGKAEHVIQSTNNIMRTLLFQASMPPAYWVESKRTDTHLFNLHPTKTLQNRAPHQLLFGTPPTYHYWKAEIP
jgi:hypothetical protein